MDDRPNPQFPLASFLGMVTEQTERGSAISRVKVTPEQLNPHGSVHGAVLFAMVDTAMGAATMSVLDEDQLCASLDVQVRFCKPAFDGELVATATVMQAGKRIVQLQAEVRDQDGGLVGLASGSFAVIPRPR
jgi:acyl-CoA thioesterase